MKRLIALFCALLLLGGCAFMTEGLPVNTPSPSPELTTPRPQGTKAAGEALEPLPDDGRFTLRYAPEDSLNPYACASEVNRLLCPLLYDCLVDITPDFQAEPALCEEWSSEDGGRSFFLKLRAGTVFSDGTDLSAWDAAYSLNRAREDTSFYAGRLRCIREVSVSEDGLRVYLNESLPSFPLRLDIPIVKEGTAYRDVPTGTGLYIYAEEEEGAGCLLPNPYSPHAASLPCSRVELSGVSEETAMAALASGALDILIEEPGHSDPNAPEGAARRGMSTTILYYMACNPYCSALSDSGRRRLVNAMLDRGSLSAVLGGEATFLPIHPALPEYDDTEARSWLPRDLKEFGIEILTEDYDGDGMLEYFQDGLPTPFTFRILVCSENEASTAAARSIADDLQSHGVLAELRLLNESDYLRAVRNGDYEACIASMRLTSDFDLSALYRSMGDDFLRMLAEEYRSSEGEERLTALASLGAYSAECSLVLPLTFLRRTLYYSQGAVENMEPSWTNPFRNFSEWKLNGEPGRNQSD